MAERRATHALAVDVLAIDDDVAEVDAWPATSAARMAARRRSIAILPPAL
jgi:hypothetical protein